MTADDSAAFFDEQWPAIAADLGRWLPRHGVPRQEVADVTQETAVRLLRRWAELDRTQPLGGFARVVALNVWRDRAKSAAARRELCVETLPEPAVDHVERDVLARVEALRVLRTIATLPGAQRDALRGEAAAALAGAGDTEPRGAAYRMLLMRARRALAAKLQPLVPPVWWRRLAQPDVAGATAAAMAVLVLSAPPDPRVAAQPDPPPPAERRVVLAPRQVGPAAAAGRVTPRPGGSRRAPAASPPAPRARPPATAGPAPSPTPSPTPSPRPPAPGSVTYISPNRPVVLPTRLLPSPVTDAVEQAGCAPDTGLLSCT